MKKHPQNGMAHLGLLLLAAVAAVIAFAAYKVEQNNKKGTDTSSGTASSQTVKTIKTTADLNSVENTLDGINFDNNLNPADYNQDVQSLL
ncbi:MAG TPA: hypothetical protein VFJ84_03145 [Candidatus Saccharimonadales bacterium]|nr:hypothetical protein [Candidatus Saccharimonadales bacterium]